MKIRSFFIIMPLLALTIAGCGFGGFSDSGSSTASQTAADTPTQIKGVVAKGPFDSGKVQLYTVNKDGSKTLANSAVINAFGNYSASIGSTSSMASYTGVVLLAASGRYPDEASGAELSIDEGSPLRAAVVNPSGKAAAAVTALTELAVRKAGQDLTTNSVNAANALLSDTFKVDIVGTMPVPVTQEAFGYAGTTQAQKDYSLDLAAISQLSMETGSLEGILSSFSTDLAGGTLSAANAAAFRKALLDFLGSDKNQTGVTDINRTNLAGVGGTTGTIKISTAGMLDPGTTINGITLTLQFPPGASIKADFSDPGKIIPLSGVIASSGVVPAGSQIIAKYIPASGASAGSVTIAMANSTGFAVGEFLSINCDIATGASLASSDFRITAFEVKDGNGAILFNSINNVAVTLE